LAYFRLARSASSVEGDNEKHPTIQQHKEKSKKTKERGKQHIFYTTTRDKSEIGMEIFRLVLAGEEVFFLLYNLEMTHPRQTFGSVYIKKACWNVLKLIRLARARSRRSYLIRMSRINRIESSKGYLMISPREEQQHNIATLLSTCGLVENIVNI
jgi:hypothetical protein